MGCLTSSLIAAPVITEFLANNESGLQDEDGDAEDWVEIFNPDPVAIDLSGWYLTDDAGDLTQWEFPAITIQPGEFLVVFASKKNRTDPAANLHTNFKLSSAGEYLALVRPDGTSVEQDFGAMFPAQQPDISFGVSMNAVDDILISQTSPAKYIVPGSEIAGWKLAGFDDGSWAMGSPGFGYETSPADYAGILQTPLPEGTTTAYLRQVFPLLSVPDYVQMKLRIRYDDGFIAYLNDVEIARRNAPLNLVYNAAAISDHSDSLAVEFEEIDVSVNIGNLAVGENVLAIHALNKNPSSDMLMQAELIAISAGLPMPLQDGYMSNPSPGSANAISGPLVINLTKNPTPPAPTSDLVITATVVANHGNAITSVNMIYRVNYDSEMTLPMNDDGATGGDAVAGDGIYTAMVPDSAYDSGDMVRWACVAEDSVGLSQMPIIKDVDGQDRDEEYHGTVVNDANILTALPVLHWFTADESANNTRGGTRVSLFFNGKFYDNLFSRTRGQSAASWTKPKFKFDFTSGRHFRWKDTEPKVEEFNMQSFFKEVLSGSKVSYMREPLMFHWLNQEGAHAPASEHWHVRRNGGFYGLFAFVEQVDDTFLKKHGYDAEGAMYKATWRGGPPATLSPNPQDGQYKKVLREDEPWTDLTTFCAGLDSANRYTYAWDHVDIAQWMNVIAAMGVPFNHDQLTKNYYVYHDPSTNEWHRIPWDGDQSFPTGSFLTNENWNSPLYGDDDHTQGSGNTLYKNYMHDLIMDHPVMREMFMRRLKTLTDKAYGGSHYFQNLIATTYTQIKPDADADRAIWGINTIEQGRDELLNTSLATRQTQLLTTYAAGGPTPLLPTSQSAAPSIGFGAIVHNPNSGSQDEEYIELTNTNDFAVDVSGWTLEGGVTMSMQAGTVIPSNGSVFLTPDLISFRARAASPKGGEDLFVQGNYSGHLSNFGETLILRRDDGSVAATTDTVDDASDPQRYLVISEVMYHPADPNGDAEFIELLNISDTVTLDLTGVHFSDGVDFIFPANTMLDPGQMILVVKNQVAFESVYGTGYNIAGEFANLTSLSNAGETINLDDASNSTIQSFTYGDSAPWPSPADGAGSSLVLKNPWSRPDSEMPSQWRDGRVIGGEPGIIDSTQFTGGDIILYALLSTPPTSSVISGKAVLTHRLNYKADDVLIRYWTSSDLNEWIQITPTLVGEEMVDGELEQVWEIASTLVAGDKLFVRIQVEN